jgi:sigma-B regulation protein RsbU (phosphoserine phosphatase)
MFTITALVFLALCGLRSFARAQSFDMNANRVPVISLDGLWRFHTGDDPRWADPQFDDSAWPLLRSDKSWTEQGYKDYRGVAWYRFKVVTPIGPDEPLSLQPAAILTNVLDSFEIFANGQKIAVCGVMPPHPQRWDCPVTLSSLPVTHPGGVLSMAIRVWRSPLHYVDVPPGRSFIGTTNAMQIYAQGQHDEILRDNTEVIVMTLLEGLSALFALALFFFSRSNREYLWFAAVMMFDSLQCIDIVWNSFRPMSFLGYMEGYYSCAVGVNLAFLAFLYVVLRGRRSLLLYLGILGNVFYLAWLLSSSFTQFGYEHHNSLPFLINAAALPSAIWIIALVTRRAIQGSFDARLLLVPVLAYEGITSLNDFAVTALRIGWHYDLLTIGDVTVFSEPFRVTVYSLVDLLFMLAMLVILINRFIHTRREQDRFTAELEAARSVQRLLLPSEVPDTPGFVIESVYLPAQEVGGDFFHVAHGDDGSVLIVVGDVSGKGLSAAMTVSAVIGALRDYTERTPGEVLRHLNRVLHGHISGFATCCAALVSSDGALSMANAGHLSPYRNGVELELEGGLPLGLAEDAEYGESRFTLAGGDRLTFISDGVVEAMNPQGELFGFERTLAISQEPAQTMANTAKAFGQEDDITVLAVSYLPVASA